MLSQRAIQLWEGVPVPFRENHHVDTKRSPWNSSSLQRRRRLNTGRGVVVCSQGIQSVEPHFVRGPSQLQLDDGIPSTSNGLDCGESATSSASARRRVSLRSPAPLPEGSRLDSEGDTSDLADVQPDAIAEPDAPNNSFEQFIKARAAGLPNSTKEGGGLGLGTEEVEYYTPMIGDYVMGIVASGTFGRFDINIGAKELGHLFRKDVMPLDSCDAREMSWEFQNSPVFAPPHGIRFVRDEEVLNLAPEVPMAVELGTVLAMEVKGMTPSGRALLSARSVAREYAWQRVRQLIGYHATLEVQITEWTAAGLIAKIEGLRAFLPTYYLVNQVPESSSPVSVSYKEYVGKKISVMISSVDEKRSNLVISEKKAWMAKNAYIGSLVEGIVTEIHPYGVHLRIKNTDISGVLHISNISRARVDNIASVFSIGEEVKAMVVPSYAKKRLSFSTADLETEHGLILRNKQAVFQDAERIAVEIAKAYKNKQSESMVDKDDSVEVVDQEIVIANWDWLDFSDTAKLD